MEGKHTTVKCMAAVSKSIPQALIYILAGEDQSVIAGTVSCSLGLASQQNVMHIKKTVLVEPLSQFTKKCKSDMNSWLHSQQRQRKRGRCKTFELLVFIATRTNIQPCYKINS